ncbi:MAG: ankyrin repeat domain-containing protein [Alphaproteobacteria bacterium]|nr:ankyrin repeat domain-containing protein [Alphaproteobacteria bacterium]
MHTSGVFDILAQCAVDAPTASPLNGMQLSLKSCYGGMSVLDGERLPHYCSLITQGGKEYPTHAQQGRDSIVHAIHTYDPSLSVLSNFAEDWTTTPETHTLVLGHSKQTISMRAPHKHPLGTMEAVKLYLENTQRTDYLDWCKKLSTSTSQEENLIKQSIQYVNEIKISDAAAHTYLANLDIFHCYVRKRPLIDFLDKTGRHPDQLHLNRTSLLAIFSDKGLLHECTTLLERGANPNCLTREGDSLLHHAIRHDNLMFFNTLLRYGASTDKEFNGKTLFAFAHDNEKANFADALMQYKLFPLHWSIRNQFDEKTQEYLNLSSISSNLDIQFAPKNQTSLHVLAKQGKTNIAEVFLEKGANPNIHDSKGRTPLHIAAMKGHADLVTLLIENKADFNALDNTGHTPLYYAAAHEQKEIVNLLTSYNASMDIGWGDNSSPLHYAVKNKMVTLVEECIRQQLPLNGKDEDGYTPLHLAAKSDSGTIIDLLLSAGADVNATTGMPTAKNTGMTPLYIASCYGKLEAVKTLVSAHADINKPDLNGRTPLDRALYNNKLDVADYLLTQDGIQINQPAHDNSTPLHQALRSSKNFSMVKPLLKAGANPALADKNGVTALHLIAQRGSKETLEEVLQTINKDAIHAKDSKNKTPLNYAEESKKNSEESKKNANEKVKLLKEYYTHKTISNESQSAALLPKHPPHPRINKGPEHPGERGMK